MAIQHPFGCFPTVAQEIPTIGGWGRLRGTFRNRIGVATRSNERHDSNPGLSAEPSCDRCGFGVRDTSIGRPRSKSNMIVPSPCPLRNDQSSIPTARGVGGLGSYFWRTKRSNVSGLVFMCNLSASAAPGSPQVPKPTLVCASFRRGVRRAYRITVGGACSVKVRP